MSAEQRVRLEPLPLEVIDGALEVSLAFRARKLILREEMHAMLSHLPEMLTELLALRKAHEQEPDNANVPMFIRHGTYPQVTEQ